MTGSCKITQNSSDSASGKVEKQDVKADKVFQRVLRLQKHRVNMVEYRLKKKKIHNSLQTEHYHLERVMKKYLKMMQNEVSNNCAYGSGIYEKLRDLIVEKEALQTQNTALYREIKRHEMFRKVSSSFYQGTPETDTPLLPVSDDDKGWWVQFSNASPSFYFHPYSLEQVNTTANPLDPEFTANSPITSKAGTFLGWSIRRHLSRSEDLDNKMISRVQVTKRVFNSLETAFKVVVMREKELRPLLMTPIDWNFTKQNEISVQVLQEIDACTRIMVKDIPGQKNVRYMFLARTAEWKLQDGKRKMGCSMMTLDSEANKLSRDAEMIQNDVEWITESWAYLTLTEVDDGSVDVLYEHCAECESESHAGLLMAQWVQFLVRWEQIVVPSNLVTCSTSDGKFS